MELSNLSQENVLNLTQTKFDYQVYTLMCTLFILKLITEILVRILIRTF